MKKKISAITQEEQRIKEIIESTMMATLFKRNCVELNCEGTYYITLDEIIFTIIHPYQQMKVKDYKLTKEFKG